MYVGRASVLPWKHLYCPKYQYSAGSEVGTFAYMCDMLRNLRTSGDKKASYPSPSAKDTKNQNATNTCARHMYRIRTTLSFTSIQQFGISGSSMPSSKPTAYHV